MNETAAIQSAANAILNARDFCGSEREEAREAFSGFGIKMTSALYKQAMNAADGEWCASQVEAGVTKPISSSERQSIHNLMTKQCKESKP